MGKLTISMAIFNSFWYVYQRVVQAQDASHEAIPTSLSFPGLAGALAFFASHDFPCPECE